MENEENKLITIEKEITSESTSKQPHIERINSPNLEDTQIESVELEETVNKPHHKAVNPPEKSTSTEQSGERNSSSAISTPQTSKEADESKKKMSGAQIRRLRKEKKMALGIWTEKKPNSKERDSRGLKRSYLYFDPFPARNIFGSGSSTTMSHPPSKKPTISSSSSGSNPFSPTRGNKIQEENKLIILEEKLKNELSDLTSEQLQIEPVNSPNLEDTQFESMELEEMEETTLKARLPESQHEAIDPPEKSTSMKHKSSSSISTPQTATEADKSKKKMSGAQKRKLRREQKMALGVWTEKKPSRRESQVHIFKKPYLYFPSGNVGGPGSSKTVLHPPFKKSTRSSFDHISSSSCSNTASSGNLKMAVISKLHPDVTLDRQQAEIIQNKLLAMIDKVSFISDTPPQFEDAELSEGILWITCANTSTKTWLQQSVEKIPLLWKGGGLTAVEPKNVPKKIRVALTVPNVVDSDTIKARLQKQNSNLNTAKWNLLSRKVETTEQTLCFSIDQASYNCLERAQFRAFCGLCKVTFRVVGEHQPK